MARLLGYSSLLPYLLLISAIFSITVSSDETCTSKVRCNECLENTKVTSPFIIFGDSHFNVAPAPNDKKCFPSKLEPYGKTIFEATGRLSDGEIIPDFIAKKMKYDRIKPYNKSLANQPDTYKKYYENGINFAVVGAGALHKEKGKNLGEQVEQYEAVANKTKSGKIGSVAVPIYIKNTTLYMFSIGGSDYFHEAKNQDKITEETVKKQVNEVIDQIMLAIERIYNVLDGRRFAFLNMGPLHRFPGVNLEAFSNQEKIDYLQKLAERHNLRLEIRMEEFRKEKPDFSYSILDYYNATERLADDGKLIMENACCGYGIRKGSGCGVMDPTGCDEPSKYVFWDGFHNTHAFNSRLADLFWDGKDGEDLVKPRALENLVALDQAKVKLIDIY